MNASPEDIAAQPSLHEGDIIPGLGGPTVEHDASNPMNTFMGFLNAGLMFEVADTLTGAMANMEIAGAMPNGTGFEAMQNTMQGPAPAPNVAPTTPGQNGPGGMNIA